MALIKISDSVIINSNKIDSIESKKDKTWIQIGSRSYTLDIPMIDFIKKLGTEDQQNGGQHFAG